MQASASQEADACIVTRSFVPPARPPKGAARPASLRGRIAHRGEAEAIRLADLFPVVAGGDVIARAAGDLERRPRGREARRGGGVAAGGERQRGSGGEQK